MVDAPAGTSTTPMVPSHSSHPPATPVSHSLSTTGPNRANQVSKQARLNHKELVLTGKANAKTLTPLTPSVNVPTIEVLPVVPPQMDTLQAQTNTPATNSSSSGPTEPNAITTNSSFATMPVLDDNASDSGSYTSTLPDVFDVGMDDLAPPATGLWVIMDHLTGEMIVDDNDPVVTAPTVPQGKIEIGVLPCLGVCTLIQTEPPTLLFEDKEVRPRWLIVAAKEFLRYTPYYGCFGKVIDLFLAQEARLGYPELVIYCFLLYCICH